VKQQFLDCVKALQQSKVLNIQRANMELAVIILGDSDGLVDRLLGSLRNEVYASNLVTSQRSDQTRIQFQIQPHMYKTIEKLVRSLEEKKATSSTSPMETIMSGPSIRLEIVQQVVLPDSTSSDIATSSIGQHHLEKLNPSNADNSTASEMDVRNQITPLLSSLSLQSPEDHDKTPPVPMKNRKERRGGNRPDPEYQSSVAAQRQIREARQSQQSNEGPLTSLIASDSNSTELKSCNTCGGAFNAAQYRSHFKSDWHRYNVKLKMKGSAPIDEKEFSLVDSDAFFCQQLE
jgi:hypothetical protein